MKALAELCAELTKENNRLAEVNEELLWALEAAKKYLYKRVVNTGGEGETKVLPVITNAIAKAKEQQ